MVFLLSEHKLSIRNIVFPATDVSVICNTINTVYFYIVMDEITKFTSYMCHEPTPTAVPIPLYSLIVSEIVNLKKPFFAYQAQFN